MSQRCLLVSVLKTVTDRQLLTNFVKRDLTKSFKTFHIKLFDRYITIKFNCFLFFTHFAGIIKLSHFVKTDLDRSKKTDLQLYMSSKIQYMHHLKLAHMQTSHGPSLSDMLTPVFL